jgi:hypothetical protein
MLRRVGGRHSDREVSLRSARATAIEIQGAILGAWGV